jgi:hypothetical protein
MAKNRGIYLRKIIVDSAESPQGGSSFYETVWRLLCAFSIRETRLMRQGANPSRSENADVPGWHSNRCPVDRPMPSRLKCITSRVIVFGMVCQSRQSTQEARVLLKKCRWELDKVRVPGRVRLRHGR